MNYSESQKAMLWAHPSSIVYEKKLDSALRKTSIRMLRRSLDENMESEYNYDLKLLLKHNSKEDLMDLPTDNSCYAAILQDILLTSDSGNVLFPKKSRMLSKCYKMAMDNMHFQHQYSLTANKLESATNASTNMEIKHKNLVPTLLIQNIMAASDAFRSVIDMTAFTKRRLGNSLSDEEKLDELAKTNHKNIRELGVRINWSVHHCVISLSTGEQYLMPLTYLLLIHNKLSDLVSVLILAQYQEGVCHPVGSMDIIVKMIKEMASLSIRYKDNFSNISASIEGMVIGETLCEAESWDNTDLLINIQDDLLESIGFNYMTSRLRTILVSANIPLRNELGCLSKIMGHPFVDMEKGAKKLHKRTTQTKELTYKSVAWVVNKAKETFVRNYISRHHRWPLCNFSIRKPGKDPMYMACMKNVDPYHPSITNRYGNIDIDDWARVEFEPVMEFQQLENIIPFLKDKSVSVFRNQAVQHYLSDAREKSYRWEDTRLLLYYLLNPLRKLDHQKFLAEYTNADTLEQLADYLIIRLVPKEKEHKIAFRGFGVKTYLDRLRSLAQEKNTAKFLDMYCDEQAMTLSEIDISKRLYAYRTILKAYRGYRVLYVNFDSSGWNNCFRDETVNPVMRETLSKIFDNTILDRIHEAYENSLFVVPDGDITYSWDGQQGGIDGLNQYAWVWIYINQIKYAMADFPVKYHMLCKGDDMRLAILIHPSMLEAHDMKYYHSEIVNKVETVAQEFGHEIKVQESYGSEKYFTFSKSASVGSIELPQGFRKIQKVYGANNAMIAVLDEYVASSFSNAHSACRCMTNTYSSYFTCLVWSYWQIMSSPYYNNLNDKQIMALLLVPNMLGGFPIIYLHNMRVRAESDLLSPFIHMVAFAKEFDKEIYKYLMRFLHCKVNNTPDMTKLYRDPYSLNIQTPTLPVSKLRSFILPALKSKVKNEDMKELIRANESPENKMMIKCMASAYPQDAKVLSTIYSATPEGILGELLRKFESGRSVLELMMLRGNRSRADRQLISVLNTESFLQKWRCNKMNDQHVPGSRPLMKNIDNTMCPAEIAQYLRDSTWKTKITGVSMPPLAHQMTIVRPLDVQESLYAKRNHFLYEYEPPSVGIQEDLSHHWMVGDKNPFLGYTTRTGNIAPTVSFQDKDPLIIKVKNILDLFSWTLKTKYDEKGDVEVCSNLDDLLRVILSLYTNITAAELAPFTAVRKSGTIQHHSRAPRFRESIVPNILSNMYQNVVGMSNSHLTLTSSTYHYKINFLHVMCEAIHQIHMELETGPVITSPRLVWGVTTDCEYCSTPIEEEPIVIDTRLLPVRAGSVLNACRLENVAKEMILKSYTDFNETQFKIPEDDDHPEEDLASVAVVAELINHMFRTHNTIQTRFTQHALTSEGHNTLVNLTHKTMSRDIGFTEIKRMSSELLIRGLSYPVYDFIQTTIGIKDHMRILVELQKIHSYELPWHRLLDILHQCRKMGELLLRLKNMTGISPPACFENPTAATPYVGYCMYVLVINGKLPIQISIRSYLPKELTVKEFDIIFMPHKWKMLKRYFINVAAEWIPNTDAPDLRFLLCLKALYICLSLLDDDDLADHIRDKMPANKFSKIDLGKFLVLDPEYMTVALEDELDRNTMMVRWLQEKYPSWPWEDAIENIMTEDIDTNLEVQVINVANTDPVEIGFCDIAASIAIIRATNNDDNFCDYLMTDNSDVDDTMFVPVRLGDITVYGPSTNKPKGIFEWNCRVGKPSMDRKFYNNEFDYTYDKIVFDEAHYLRIYGSQTTSQSKLDYIFTVTGTKKELPDFITLLCAGDGYGGFVEYLSTMTRNSTFVFNTLLTTPGKRCFPFAATESLTDQENKVDISLLDQGIDDLSSDLCRESLKKTGYLYSVVTCDADVHWSDTAQTESIVWNVIDIYLSSSLPDSILVMKMNMGQAILVVNACSKLRRYCKKVYVIRCPQSNIGGEIYVYAFSIVRHYDKDTDIKAVCNDEESRLFQRFVLSTHREFKSRLEKVNYSTQPLLIRGSRALFSKLNAAATIKFQSRLGVDFDLANELPNFKYKDRIFLHLENIALNQSEEFLDMVENPEKRGLKRAAYVQETLTHLRICAMRYITCVGFHWMISTSQDTSKISKKDIRTKFNETLEMLPTRLRIFPPSKDFYKASYSMHDVSIIRPYMRFMDGVRLAQMTIGYIFHSRLPHRERKINLRSLFEEEMDE